MTTKSVSDSGSGADRFFTDQMFASGVDASTEFYWDVDGVPLNTFAYAIKSVGGSRLQPPPMRGDNNKIPYLPGQGFLPKTPDSRTMSLEMFVIGALPDGTIMDEARFDWNWRNLVNLLWNPRKEFVLTKRFRAGHDDTVTKASGLGQYQQGLTPTMTGRRRADFTVDIFMADPFFYGDPVAIPFGPLPGSSTSQTFNVLGDWSTRDIKIDMAGALTSPIWTYQTPLPAQWLRYNAAVNSGDSAHIDVRGFKATQTVLGTVQKASGYPQWSGGHFWLELAPGPATVTFSASAGTGSSTLTYQPVWL